jgi:hypothetical protein
VGRSGELFCLFAFLSPLLSFHCIKALEVEAEKDEEVEEVKAFPREKVEVFLKIPSLTLENYYKIPSEKLGPRLLYCFYHNWKECS